MDSRLRRSPPDRASAVPMDKPGKRNAFPPPCHRSAAAPQASQHAGTTRDDFDFGEWCNQAAGSTPLAYSSPEAVQTTGTVAVGGDEPVTLTALAEHVIAANGGGKYYIREFPPERKRIDIGDFLTNDTRFRALSGWRPRFRLADGLRIHSNIIASISQVTCRATR